MAAKSTETDQLNARLRRVERAVAELAGDLHGLSRPEQLAARGQRALAELLAAYHAGQLETAELKPEESR